MHNTSFQVLNRGQALHVHGWLQPEGILRSFLAVTPHVPSFTTTPTDELLLGHSMSNQPIDYLTLTDLDETWFLLSVC